MNKNTSKKPPIWFWTISILAFLWNAMGVNAYIQQAYRTESFEAEYTSAQLEVIENMPAWATAAFAFAVFGGLLGCIALLLRKKWAKSLLLISLIGIVVQMFYNLFMVDNVDSYGPGGVIMPVLVIVIGVFLIWFAKKSEANTWLT
jgi:hypothetical protein